MDSDHTERIRLHNEGKTAKEIAKTLGYHPQTIADWLKRRKLTPNGGTGTWGGKRKGKGL